LPPQTSHLNFAQTNAHLTLVKPGLAVSAEGVGEFVQRIQGNGNEPAGRVNFDFPGNMKGIGERAQRPKGRQQAYSAPAKRPMRNVGRLAVT